jgi:hypothetical protein
MEQHTQLICPLAEDAIASDSPLAEHVVDSQEKRVVQKNVGVRVEAFEIELDPLPRQKGRVRVEREPVLPVLILDPLEVLLIVCVKWIRYQAPREEIGMDTAGNGGPAPCTIRNLPEVPALFEVHHRYGGAMSAG